MPRRCQDLKKKTRDMKTSELILFCYYYKACQEVWSEGALD